MNLKSRVLQSFYQPGDLVSFQVGGKMLLATADTGSVRKYSLSTCHFDESSDARGWNQREYRRVETRHTYITV